MGKVIKGIGKIVGKVAPFAAPFIPGVGPLAAAAIGAGGKLLGGAAKGKVRISDLLGGAAAGGLGRIGAGKLGGLGGIGRAVGKTFTTPEGGLDIQRLLGAGAGISNIIGQRAQRKSAQKRLGAEDAVRNQILQRLLERPQFDFTPSTLNTPRG